MIKYAFVISYSAARDQGEKQVICDISTINLREKQKIVKSSFMRDAKSKI